MKNLKFTVALILGFLVVSNSLNAQSKPAISQDRKGEMVEQMKMDKEKLALSPEQEVKFKEISKKYAEKMKSLRADDEVKKEKMEAIQKLKSEKDAEMKSLLSETQFKTYTTIQEERKMMRKERKQK